MHVAEQSLQVGRTFDAVLHRLIVLREAVKAISPELPAEEPDIDWPAAAQLRDRLAHRSWDTLHAIVVHVVQHDLDPMRDAIERVRVRLAPAD